MVFHAAAGMSGSATFSFTASDGAGGTDTLSDQLTVRVVNQAPVLDGVNPLPAVGEDASDNPGMRVEDLIAGHASDPGGRTGVAVVAASSSAGQWQYSRDDGAHWSNFDGVSAASAELLRTDGQTRIRFVPNADWNGTATGLAFRAWTAAAAPRRRRAPTHAPWRQFRLQRRNGDGDGHGRCGQRRAASAGDAADGDRHGRRQRGPQARRTGLGLFHRRRQRRGGQA
jgi:hypothetical protein